MTNYNKEVYIIGKLKVTAEIYHTITQEDRDYIADHIGEDAQYLALMSCVSKYRDFFNI
jgi:hypothetical protein